MTKHCFTFSCFALLLLLWKKWKIYFKFTNEWPQSIKFCVSFSILAPVSKFTFTSNLCLYMQFRFPNCHSQNIITAVVEGAVLGERMFKQPWTTKLDDDMRNKYFTSPTCQELTAWLYSTVIKLLMKSCGFSRVEQLVRNVTTRKQACSIDRKS